MDISKALFGAEDHPGTKIVPIFGSILSTGMLDGWTLSQRPYDIPSNARIFGSSFSIAVGTNGQFITIHNLVSEKILLDNAQRYSHWVTLPTKLGPGHAFLYLDAILGGVFAKNADFTQYSLEFILDAISNTFYPVLTSSETRRYYHLLTSDDIIQMNQAYLTGTHRGLEGASWPTVSEIVSGAGELVSSAGKAISGAVTGAHEAVSDLASDAISGTVVKTYDKTLTGVTDSSIKNLRKGASAAREEFEKTKSAIGGVFSEMLLQSSVIILGSLIIYNSIYK